MYYINSTPSENGNYGNPQSAPFENALSLPDELLSDYIATKGFAALIVSEGIVAGLSRNDEAYNAYTAEHPDAEQAEQPTEVEQLRADVDFLLAMGGYIE